MKTSKIEWTDATWNPSIGCDKISAGCKNCYAEIMAKRLQAMRVKGYEDAFKFKILPERLAIPKKIKKPTKFFVNSMSDLFHESMPFDYLDEVFKMIRETPYHAYQILTKREKVLEEYFKNNSVPDNVWLGVTVENKLTKNRIESLNKIDAKIKFLSCEPLLENLEDLNLSKINWVIVGGESGSKGRPMLKEWVVNIKEQCHQQNVLFFFKQWGTWGEDGVKRNKKVNGRIILGREWNEEPKFSYKNNRLSIENSSNSQML
jgi:protein gp37